MFVETGSSYLVTDMETGSIFRMGSAAVIAKIHIGSIYVSAQKSANGFYTYLPLHGVEVLWTCST